MKHYLDFEKPIADLDVQISELMATPDFDKNEGAPSIKEAVVRQGRQAIEGNLQEIDSLAKMPGSPTP